MYHRIVFCLFILIGLTVNAQTTINVRGAVSNQAGKPIADAIVTLAGQGLKDTTGSDGSYSLTKGDVSVLPLLIPSGRTIFLNGDFLEFSLPNPSSMKVEIFDVKGNLLKRESLPNALTGFYHFNIAKNFLAAKLLIIRASIGRDEVTFRCLPLHNGKYIVNQSHKSSAPAEENRLTKIAAIIDTLKIIAPGYTATAMAITSYDKVVNITLDTIGGGGAAVPSAGCGKATTLKGQTYLTIPSGGASREYIVRLPDDYDSNHPYRLIMSIHCLMGSDTMVANPKGYEYYGLWKLANTTKGTTIFCSPQGTKGSMGMGWDNSNGKDVEFIRTLINKFKSELCIDTTRIFSEGFSMGGSMSYALACAMPGTIRAIAAHSGGPMSGCDKKNRGPVAYFMTHGTTDGVCKYPGYGVPEIKDIASVDGCQTLDIAGTLKPTDASGMNPVCASFQGCKTNFPCRACIFVGDHTATPGGQAKTWVPDSTWKWFTQF
jgi:poly(3-hydroxybutyrate) depolymerase